MVTYPIFSVSTAHTNDFTDPGSAVEVNASLLFIYGIGAIFSPLLTSNLIERFGPGALFAFIALAHLALVMVSLARMRVRPTAQEKTTYTYVPRTSFTIGKLLSKKSNPEE